MTRRPRRQPEPSLKRLLERRELMKQIAAMPHMAEQEQSLRVCIAGLERRIRDKMTSEPGCWMVKPGVAKLDAAQSEQVNPDVTFFQPVKRPSWLRSQF